MPQSSTQADMITLGKISGVFGVKGWVKVFSHTEQRESILAYSPWFLQIAGEWKPYEVKTGQVQGKGIVAQLQTVDDRDQAQTLVGCSIAIPRERLRSLRQDEYYWADLIGMEVVNLAGFAFGKVDSLFETGSNDVLVVRSDVERLVPWIMHEVIKSVALDERRIVVDWDPDF
ncbi:MAG: ribosome maturation factor RimM [Pseudomonadota bacterium]